MTIGWDRRMKPYEKHKEIPPTQIAVDPQVLDKETQKGRRRLSEVSEE